MRDQLFGWSYPPGCSGPPEFDEEEEWVCVVCDLPTHTRNDYCGPSCEQAYDDEIVATDFTWYDEQMDVPFVLARSYNNPFHIPSDEETQKEKPNAS